MLLLLNSSIIELNKKIGPKHWDAKMEHYSSYKLAEVEEVAKALAAVIVKASTSKYEVSSHKSHISTWLVSLNWHWH